MPFGKRLTPPGKRTTAEARSSPDAGPPDVPVSTPASRAQALNATMLELLGKSSLVAAAIRENGGIAMPGMDDEIDALGPPLTVRGFDQHFVFTDGGRPLRSSYVYLDVLNPGAPDAAAQLHLQQVLGRIHELNRFCQQAMQDDALAVALQSPRLPPLVDGIIVGTAFFASFFENAALVVPYVEAQPMLAFPASVVSRLHESMERYRLMALDNMLQPSELEAHLPNRRWPHVGVETRWPAHVGERFVCGVYAPAAALPAAAERALATA